MKKHKFKDKEKVKIKKTFERNLSSIGLDSINIKKSFKVIQVRDNWSTKGKYKGEPVYRSLSTFFFFPEIFLKKA